MKISCIAYIVHHTSDLTKFLLMSLSLKAEYCFYVLIISQEFNNWTIYRCNRFRRVLNFEPCLIILFTWFRNFVLLSQAKIVCPDWGGNRRTSRELSLVLFITHRIVMTFTSFYLISVICINTNYLFTFCAILIKIRLTACLMVLLFCKQHTVECIVQ